MKWDKITVVLKLHLLLLISTLSFSQTHTITGVVSDSLNNPLESANIIALPKSENAQLKFAIADNKEKYRLKLVFIILFKH